MKQKLVLTLVTVMLLASSLVATIAQAETGPMITFESPPYTAGIIDGQDGWSSPGSAGGGCGVLLDHAVAAQSTYTSFGSQSLRISNARTTGCFGDQTISKSLIDEAGETEATNKEMSGGERQTRFEAKWDFASVTGQYQPGLWVTASPDRGDGSRMSYVSMSDSEGGLVVNFYDVQYTNPTLGEVANFVMTEVASGLSRDVPHTIELSMEFVDGPSNDAVTVTVDGTYTYTGGSWEDYYRYDPEASAEQSVRTVDSILFQTRGTPAPATLGYGFYIDNFQIQSGGYTIDDLRGATEELVTNARAERALLAALNRVEMYADRGNSFFAYLSLLQYVVLVERYEDTRLITPDAAQELLTLAMQYRSSLF